MQAIKSWWSGSGSGSSSNDSVNASPYELVQGLKLKRMQQLQRATQLEAEAKRAKQGGNVPQAMALMRQKSVIDTRIRQLTGQIHNMEQQNTVRESAAISEQMARTMQQGNAEITQLMQSVSVDEVDDIADDMAELSTTTYEMTDALSRPMGEAYMPIDVDDQIAAQMAAWDADTAKPPVESTPVVTLPDIVDTMPDAVYTDTSPTPMQQHVNSEVQPMYNRE